MSDSNLYWTIPFFGGVGLIIGLLIIGVLTSSWKDDIQIMLELISCEDLIKNSVFLESHFSKTFIMEECF